jgi:hypothetical protein
MRGYVEYPWYEYVADQNHAVSIPSLIERYGNAKNIRANIDFMLRDGLLIRTSEPAKKVFVRANTRLVEEFDTIGSFDQNAPIYLLANAAKWIENDALKFFELCNVGFRLSDFDLDPVRRSQVKAGLIESGLFNYDEAKKTFFGFPSCFFLVALIAYLEGKMKG